MIFIISLRFISDPNSNSSTGKDWNNSKHLTGETKTGKHNINRKHGKGQVHLSVVDATKEGSSITAIKDKISSPSSMFCSSIKSKDCKRKRGRPTSVNSLNRDEGMELPFHKIPKTKMSNNNLCRPMKENYIHTDKPFNISSSSSSSSLAENDNSDLSSRSESQEGEDGNSSTEKNPSISEYAHNCKLSGNKSNQVPQGHFNKKTANRSIKSKHQTEHREQVCTDNYVLVEIL